MNGHYGGGGGGHGNYATRDRDRNFSMKDSREEDPYSRRADPIYSTRQDESYSRQTSSSNGRVSPNGPQNGSRPQPVFELDHLATFTVSPKQGKVTPEHGVERLKHMEMTTGIWTMRCKLAVQNKDIVITDAQTQDEMERFPLHLVVDPTARTKLANNDAYDNMVLFTVLGDQQRGMESEMHIFQCIGRSAKHLVDDILAYKAGRDSPPRRDDRAVPPRPASPPAPPRDEPPRREPPGYDRVAAERNARATKDYTPGPSPATGFKQSIVHDDSASDMSDRTEHDVQMLNHCFDDIERFAVRLQNAADAFIELEKRLQKRDKKSKHKHMGDGMLTMRARPPPAKEFVDVFQKFKLSFNLLARLKSHIHDPNAPELVHFIFTPLSLACDASRDPHRGTPDLASKVVSPLLTREACDLLANCLNSKEMDLWRSLGDAWNISKDDWRGYTPPYYPRFGNGWQPSPSDLSDSRNTSRREQSRDVDRERTERAREEKAREEKAREERVKEEKMREEKAREERAREEAARSRAEYERRGRGMSPQRDPSYSRGRPSRSPEGPRDRGPPPRAASPGPRGPPPRAASPGPRRDDYGSRNGAGMPDFYDQLSRKGLKACEVLHDRDGNNEREVSIRRGEVLEVLDSSRNWWKVRNQAGKVGHAPFNILKLLGGR